MTLADSAPSALVSYSHDSPEHEQRVLQLCNDLRARGIDAFLDQFLSGAPDEGWPLWMERQIERCDFTLMVCTEAYLRRFTEHETSGVGLGVVWEARILRNLLYANTDRQRRIVPVLLASADRDFVPAAFRGTYFDLSTTGGFEELLRHLLRTPKVQASALGFSGRTQDATHDLAALLQRLLLESGLSQAELAESAQINVEVVEALERGESVRGDVVDRIASALQLDDEARSALVAAADVVRRASSGLATHNFPIQLSSFIGREQIVDDIGRLIREHRLVTLTGPGGVGKTRAALEVAAGAIDDCEGAWLVELGPLSDPSFVGGAVAAAIGLNEPKGASTETLLSFVKNRRMLIVLDNCEHVLPAVAPLSAAILQSAPLMRLLATSS